MKIDCLYFFTVYIFNFLNKNTWAKVKKLIFFNPKDHDIIFGLLLIKDLYDLKETNNSEMHGLIKSGFILKYN